MARRPCNGCKGKQAKRISQALIAEVLKSG
jgi:hypothetical protein